MDLFKNILRIKLGDFPTPVVELKDFAEKISAKNFYVKRDDISGKEYGGNKVRKLEFILADAISSGHKSVLTFGFAGSNHATATAAYANKCGLKPILMLLDHHSSEYVRKNLLSNLYNKAEIHFCKNDISSNIQTKIFSFLSKFKYGTRPYIIPVGGSSPIGIAGFINAFLELEDQIRNNELQEPDYIYVPVGSLGTIAGLIIGQKLSNIKTKIVGIRLVEKRFANTEKLLALINTTIKYFREKNNNFPGLSISHDDFILDDNFFEPGYGVLTKEIENAVKTAKGLGMDLDTTYSGKTFAALLKHAGSGLFKGKKLLFWNTYSSVDISDKLKTIDTNKLPGGFRKYFNNQ